VTTEPNGSSLSRRNCPSAEISELNVGTMWETSRSGILQSPLAHKAFVNLALVLSLKIFFLSLYAPYEWDSTMVSVNTVQPMPFVIRKAKRTSFPWVCSLWSTAWAVSYDVRTARLLIHFLIIRYPLVSFVDVGKVMTPSICMRDVCAPGSISP
jgi:hypothetical protein